MDYKSTLMWKEINETPRILSEIQGNNKEVMAKLVKAIKEKCGKDYPVSVRYSVVSKVKDFCVGAVPGEEYKEIGRDMQESEKAAKYLQDAGYDMLNCDNGTYDAW